ncbi:MAG: phosphatidate cytidylyltransferase, partial [Chlorobiales bacterium]|nr:phosphatidate cytidylyltransferase [Chlorobiales bacterium]
LFFVKLIVPEAYDPVRITIIALAATAIEGLSPKEVDNLLIPAAVIGLAAVI